MLVPRLVSSTVLSLSLTECFENENFFQETKNILKGNCHLKKTLESKKKTYNVGLNLISLKLFEVSSIRTRLC